MQILLNPNNLARIFAVFFVISISVLPGSARAQAVTRGPYLQQGTPESVIIRWRTDTATDSTVRYGNAPDNLTASITVNGSRTEHEVQIGALGADTRYYYSVGNSAGALEGGTADYFFATSPDPGSAKATRIWIIGDSGTGNANARAVRDAFKAYDAGQTTDVWLMLGDNAYNSGTDTEYQSAVFDTYPQLLQKIIVWPTLGNHDGASADSATESGPYYAIFSLPRGAEAGGVTSGTEAYYSFDYGNIHFICLDSHESDRSPGGAMLAWMENDLIANDKDWLIAYWHHPPYTKGSHDSDSEGRLIDMRENVLPILEAYGVDLVLSGHSHSYERSYLLDGHYGDSVTLTAGMIVDSGDGRETGDGAYAKAAGAGQPNQGAVYAVAGSSGKISGGALDHPAMVISLNQLGSMILDIDGNRLDAVFLNASGEIGDEFTIIKDTGLISQSLQNGVAPDAAYDGAEDTYISQNAPDSNFGNDSDLQADGDDPGGSGNDLATLMRWDLSAVPANAIVKSAVITLSVFNTSGASSYEFYELLRDWHETQASWNQADNATAWAGAGAQGASDRASQELASLTGVSGINTIRLNAAGIAVIQGWIDGAKPNYGFILADSDTDNGLDFDSSQASPDTIRPKLTITYSLPGGTILSDSFE